MVGEVIIFVSVYRWYKGDIGEGKYQQVYYVIMYQLQGVSVHNAPSSMIMKGKYKTSPKAVNLYVS